MQTTTLQVNGMSCSSCAGHVEKAIAALPDVVSVRVDLASGAAVIEHHGASIQAMAAAVEEAGFDPILPS